MSEGDEESFVILGTSPTDLSNPFITGSYENNENILSSLGIEKVRNRNEISISNSIKSDLNGSKYSYLSDSDARNMSKSNISEINYSSKNKDINLSMISNNSNNNSNVNMPSFSKMNSNFTRQSSISKQFDDKENLSTDGTKVLPAQEGSLAASFLMGDIQMDVLKASMHSQFPSLCSASVKTEEMIKLQKVLAEYIELKETLQKNNVAMRKHFATLQKWQDEVKIQKEEQVQQMNEFQQTVAKLRNENYELRKELGTKMEQIKINEDNIRRESHEMTKILSEKTAQIRNMAFQIENLEQQHLDSFEYIKKLKSEEIKESKENVEHEYVATLEHRRIVSDLEERLSEMKAQNLELDEMKEKYQDEIKNLKEKLTSCQEELKKTQLDIDVLKSNDDERNKHFQKYEKERDEMRNEMVLLKTQVEIYSKDFEMERLSRENLAGEKEKILTELRLLQKRNQELLESSRKQLENNKNLATQSSSSQRTNETSFSADQNEQVYEPSNFICPLCNRQYKLLNDLQTHVQQCIDN